MKINGDVFVLNNMCMLLRFLVIRSSGILVEDNFGGPKRRSSGNDRFSFSTVIRN